LILAGPACRGEDARLAEVREKAFFTVRSIRSMEFAFETTGDDGWRAAATVSLEEDRFRVDRSDQAGGMMQGKQIPPLKFTSAFNDKRHQMLESHDSRLILKDGNVSSVYSIDTPQTFMYLWLQSPGQTFRWDTLRSPLEWTRGFSGATYVGSETRDGISFEIVDIPQDKGVKTPCVYRVYFAAQLGHVPLSYTRRVRSSQEISSSLRVTSFKKIEVEGRSIAFPLEISYVETGKDEVSLPRKLSIKIDEATIKLNHDIDDSIFTLSKSSADKVVDIDEQNRIIQRIERGIEPNATVSDRPSAGRWLLWGNIIAGAAAVLCWLIWRRAKAS
jgi:hypothetical protein